MNLQDIFRAQYEQQEAIQGPLPRGMADRRELAQKYVLYAQREMLGYLEAAGYKHYADAPQAARSTRVEELVDAFKFLLCIAWTEGITPEEFGNAFQSKTGLVYNRHRKTIVNSRVAGFDIDGVLAEYHDWTGSGGTWQGDEAPFIERGGVLGIPPTPHAAEVVQAFAAQGLSVVMVTSRKIWRFRRMEADTYDWLNKHGIIHDRVLFGYDKMELIKQHGSSFSFFVEDNPKHALDVASGGVRVYYLGASTFGPVSHPNIITVENLLQVLEAEQNV